MRIGILTYYGVFNHGAVLQANALKTVLENMGHDCTFLSFNRNYDRIPLGQDRKYNLSIRSVGLYLKYFADKGLKNTLYNVKKHRILDQYRQESIPVGERYSDFKGDAAVIGSDEVFSVEIGINPFFYGHGICAPEVISYAASFGPTTLAETRRLHLDHLIGSGLETLSAISTRDRNSAEIVRALTGREAQLVCDPVILYGYAQEQRMFTPPDKNYILLYSYENNMNTQEETEAIRAYAKAHGFKVYATAYYHGWCDRNIQSTPAELLGWIRNAGLVVTDTFHGAVLSLICSTPMVVTLRGNQNKLGFLMEEYGLSERILTDVRQFSCVAEQKVDFEAVNRRLDERREASLEFLRGALGDGNEVGQSCWQ